MKTSSEMNANDMHNLALDIQTHDRTELSKVMEHIHKAAADGSFSVRYHGVISDPVIVILNLKGFTCDDNRKYAWTDKTNPSIDIYWTKTTEEKK